MWFGKHCITSLIHYYTSIFTTLLAKTARLGEIKLVVKFILLLTSRAGMRIQVLRSSLYWLWTIRRKLLGKALKRKNLKPLCICVLPGSNALWWHFPVHSGQMERLCLFKCPGSPLVWKTPGRTGWYWGLHPFIYSSQDT